MKKQLLAFMLILSVFTSMFSLQVFAQSSIFSNLYIVLEVGESLQLRAMANITSGDVILPNSLLDWESSDDQVATVTSDGLIIAVSSGTVQIFYENPEASHMGFMNVWVVDRDVQEHRAAIELNIGDNIRLHVRNAEDVVWTSSDNSIVNVSGTGVITAMAQGLAVVATEVHGQMELLYIRVVGDDDGGGANPSTMIRPIRPRDGSSVHTMVIAENGELWAWGGNSFGRLGDGTTTSRSTPTRIMDNARYVSSSFGNGYGHTMVIAENGELWGWGRNDFGQLGDGTTTDRLTPIRIMDNVRYVSLGHDHTMAITENDELWAWGDNRVGQLGDVTATHISTPTRIMNNVRYVSAGNAHTMAVTETGELWGWGVNMNGQVGDGTTTSGSNLTRIMDNVRYVSAGPNHTMAITETGELWTWGCNEFGQLGNGTITDWLTPTSTPTRIMDNVRYVSADRNHTMAITETGELWAWGSNNVGQLGDGTTTDRLTPTRIMDNVRYVSRTMAITEAGELWAWGGNMGDGTTAIRLTPTRIMDNVRYVSVGAGHRIAVTETGELWAWGWNAFGQLGDGTTIDRLTPVRIEFDFN